LEASDGKEIWKGSKLEVKSFVKKNERDNNIASEGNKNIYIKNIPIDFNENDIANLFEKYGEITWKKVLTENNSHKKFAIINYANDESARLAIENANGMKIGSMNLFVSELMKKQDRLKALNNNMTKFKSCNLIVKNIPYNVKEEELAQNFSQYGEIVSLKIAKEKKEIEQNNAKLMVEVSKGFGFVCFAHPDSAKLAMEKMNKNFLKKYEYWKAPLDINYFMTKMERARMYKNPNIQQNIPNFNPYNQNVGVGVNPYSNNVISYQMMNPMLQNQMGNYPMMMNQKPIPITPFNQRQLIQPNYQHQSQAFVQKNAKPQPEKDVQDLLPDLNYLNSIESDPDKKEYLGEYVFKQIELHPLAKNNNFSMDKISKITGMILGIEDIKEIYEIAKNPKYLNSRIMEALELLDN